MKTKHIILSILLTLGVCSAYTAPNNSFGGKVRLEFKDGSKSDGYMLFLHQWHPRFYEAYAERCLNDQYISDLMNFELKVLDFCEDVYWTKKFPANFLGLGCQRVYWKDVKDIYLYYIDEAIEVPYMIPALPDEARKRLIDNGILDIADFSTVGDASCHLLQIEQRHEEAFESSANLLGLVYLIPEEPHPFIYKSELNDPKQSLLLYQENITSIDEGILEIETKLITSDILRRERQLIIEMYLEIRNQFIREKEHLQQTLNQSETNSTALEAFEDWKSNLHVLRNGFFSDLSEKANNAFKIIQDKIKGLGFVEVCY